MWDRFSVSAYLFLRLGTPVGLFTHYSTPKFDTSRQHPAVQTCSVTQAVSLYAKKLCIYFSQSSNGSYLS